MKVTLAIALFPLLLLGASVYAESLWCEMSRCC